MINLDRSELEADAAVHDRGDARSLRAKLDMPLYTVLFPLAAYATTVLAHHFESSLRIAPEWVQIGFPALGLVVMMGAVFAALHHAEIVSERLGQPFGTLILTISVTAIEVTIVASMMLYAAPNPTLAREAVTSVIMVVCAGLVGICLFIGAVRHKTQEHRTQGTSAYLSVLVALSVLTLVLPRFTSTTPDPSYSREQLLFAATVSLLLYGAFLFAQTVRHPADFAEVDAHGGAHGHSRELARERFVASLVGLPISLLSVILLAEFVAKRLEDLTWGLGLPRPDAINGLIIAVLVLLPEGLAAIKAARRNALQTSLNIALGSALATIGLTIPAVVVVSLVSGRAMTLGLDVRDMMMLLLVLAVSIISFGTGRTNILYGAVHLVVFAAYILFLFVP